MGAELVGLLVELNPFAKFCGGLHCMQENPIKFAAL